MRKFIGLGVFLACVLLFLLLLLNPFGAMKYSEFEAYAVNMAYSTYGCASIRNNQTSIARLINYTKAIKDMGFKGVGLIEMECFYLDNYLATYLDYLKNESLKVVIYFHWRDFTAPFTFGEPNALYGDFWNPKSFPDNSTKAYKWIEWIENVTKITKNYDNIAFYIVYMPFKKDNCQANFYNQSGYRYFMQLAMNKIKEWDDKPILLGSDGIEIENKTLIGLIPYDLYNISGYAFNYYSRTPNQFCVSCLKDVYDLYQDKIRENLGEGYFFIGEWGYQTVHNYGYGYAESEIKKAELIRETVKGLATLHIKYWSYFAIQDFPSENRDFGLIDSNFKYRESGNVMKEILKG